MAALNENTIWTWNAIGKRRGAWALDPEAPEANKRTAGNGVKVTEYVMGKPSREIVALGYAAKAKGLSLDTI